MLSIEQQQLAIQALIAQRPVATSDPWLKAVAESSGLKMIHRIGGWWQRFQLESQCRYTTRLMKQLGCFESLVEQHFLSHPTLPAIEELTTQFLAEMRYADDPLLASVAHFELACIKMRDAPAAHHVILWDRNPNLVLTALEGFSPLPSSEPGASYTLTLDPSQAGGMSCVRECLEESPKQYSGAEPVRA